jgi:hypothetical protein
MALMAPLFQKILPWLLMVAVAAGQESVDPTALDPADDFSPMLFLFALIAVCVMLFLLGVAIVVGVVAALALGLLVALGIISSSALLGILRRKFSTGLRALHYQLCGVAMIPAGIGVLWLGRAVFDLSYRTREMLWIGSLAGLCGGLLLAFALDRIVVAIYRRVVLPKSGVVIDVG